MILSYRKRASSSDDVEITSQAVTPSGAAAGAHNHERISATSHVSQLSHSNSNNPSTSSNFPPSKATLHNPIVHHRKNKSFSTFFQNLFQGSNNNARNNNDGGGNPSGREIPKTSVEVQIAGPSSRVTNPAQHGVKQIKQGNQSEKRRDSNASYNNHAFSSSSSAESSESINTILSTNSFSFVHPKKYRGKTRRGKRIPIDLDGEEKSKESTPVKLKTQHAQPMPNSRRKKLSTLSKLGMKIGLKSKYNLQSCESLQQAAASSATKTSVISNNGEGSGNSTRTRLNKRRAPLPPLPPSATASTSAALLVREPTCSKNSEPRLKSYAKASTENLKTAGGNEKKHPSSSNPNSSPFASTSRAAQSSPSNQNTPSSSRQHSRSHSEGSDSHHHPRPSTKVYYHVRGKRKAPVPPVRLLAISRLSVSETHQPQQASTSKAVPVSPSVHKKPESSPRSGRGPLLLQVQQEAQPPLSRVSDDEEIVQNILNAQQEEELSIPNPKPTTTQNKSTNVPPAHSSSASAPSTSANVVKNSSSSHKNNFSAQSATPSSYHLNRQVQNENKAQRASSKCLLANKSLNSSPRPRQCTPITTTLGCYESFDEDEDDRQTSTNSLLIHENRLNEQVKSQLTKGSQPKENKMPFFFKSKKISEKGASSSARGEYANGQQLLAPTPTSLESPSSSPNSPTTSSRCATSISPSMTPVEPISPTKMTPRPWYKRSSSKEKNSSTSTSGSSPNNNANRNKPSISVLTNLSELDREAAQIVEEKRRRSAIEQNYTESAKELITMFNSTFGASNNNTSINHAASDRNSHVASGQQDASPSTSGFRIGSDERRKLAVVQPQSNPNFKMTKSARPTSTPSSSRWNPPAESINDSPRPQVRENSTTTAPIGNTDEWSCPRCTLKNAHWRSFCDACNFRQASTLVCSIASIFETNTNSPTESPRAPDRRIVGGNATHSSSRAPSSGETVSTSTHPATQGTQISNAPPCENFLSQEPSKEKLENREKLSGIKLQAAGDPEVEFLNIEELREARLAFFARNKVVSPNDFRKSPVASFSSKNICSTVAQPSSSSGFQAGKTPSDGNKSKATLQNQNIRPNDLNSITNRKENEDPENFDTVIQLHQELNPNLSNSGPTTWKPFYPARFHPILASIVESSAAKRRETYSNADSTDHIYELDPTYENWHLKLSDFEKEINNCSKPSASSSAMIRNISTEIKDQINYFDRLKTHLREQRTAQYDIDDDEDDYTNSESDASTVIYESIITPREMANRKSNVPHASTSQHQRNSFGNVVDYSRRRISLGDADYERANGFTAPNGLPNFSNSDRSKERRRASYENGGGGSPREQQPEFRKHENGAKGSNDESERKLRYRALEHSTSAISKLLRKLEWAINVGDHKLAASLAHDLAILKVNCTVEKSPQPITIRVYVEDRFMQQGPFQVPVISTTTVAELKMKIQSDWGIPVPFQKWILGKKIADNDNQSLADYGIVHDSMAFLYLVTPGQQPETTDSKQQEIKKPESPQPAAHEAEKQNLASSLPLRNNKIPDSSIAKAQPTKVSKVDSSTSTNEIKQFSPVFAYKREEMRNQTSIPSQHPISNSNCKEPWETSASIEKIQSTQVVPQEKLVEKDLQSTLNNRKKLPTSSSELTGIGVPQSSKNVSSKYIESVKQTNNESLPLLPNALKQGIRIGNSERTGENFTKQKPENVEMAANANGKSSSGTMLNSEKSAPIVLQSSPASSAHKLNQNSSASKHEKDVKAKLNPDSIKIQQMDAKSEKINENILTPKKGVERLLETKSELANKNKSTSSPENKSKVPQKPLRNPKSESETVVITSFVPVKAKMTHITEITSLPIASVLPKPITMSPIAVRKCDSVSAPDPLIYLTASAQIKSEGTVISQRTVNDDKAQKSKTSIEVERISEKNSGPKKTAETGSNTSFSKPPKAVAAVDSDKTQLTAAANKKGSNNENKKPEPTIATSVVKIANNAPPDNLIAQGSQLPVKPKATPPTGRWAPAQSDTEISGKSSQIIQDGEKIKLFGRKDSDAIDINLQVSFAEPSKVKEAAGAKSNSTENVRPGPSSPSSTTTGVEPEKKEDNNETYRKMLQLMENEDCVRSTEELECPICFNKIAIGTGVTLRECLHSFCRDCLAGTIQYSDEAQVKCPFRDSNYSCESYLQEREIKGLVSPTMFERHLAQSIKLAENKIANTFHCKTNDCTGWCIFEDDVNIFKCPVCRKSNCLTCQAIHDGKNCRDYQRELALAAETDEGAKSSRLMLEKMIQRGEALDCPACHVVLLKKWGCDWVRCSYCKTEICWVTKSFRWGKNGKGDLSGGCKCGVNGIKCHPKCTYCH